NAARPQIQHRQVMMGAQVGIRGDTFVREKAKIEGYLPDDAEYFVDLADAHRMEHARQKMITAVETAYDVGTLLPEEAGQQLHALRLGFDDIRWRLTAIDAEHIAHLVRET